MNYNSIWYFHYNDPKTRNTLKVWDKRPLVLPLYITHKHTLGINIHWISTRYRIQFINTVLEASVKIKNKKKLARFTYDLIKRDRRYRHALKGIRKYINKRVTNAKQIPANEVGKKMLLNPKYFARKVKNKKF